MAKEVMTGRFEAAAAAVEAPPEAGVPGTMLVTVLKDEAAGDELEFVLDDVEVAGEGEHDDVEDIAILRWFQTDTTTTTTTTATTTTTRNTTAAFN